MVTATLFDDPHILVNGQRASLRRKELALVAYLALEGSGTVFSGSARHALLG